MAKAKDNGEFVIEHGIPVPPAKGIGLTAALRKLKVGDSVVLPVGDSFHSLAHGVGIKIVQRRQPDGRVRVWRIK